MLIKIGLSLTPWILFFKFAKFRYKILNIYYSELYKHNKISPKKLQV